MSTSKSALEIEIEKLSRRLDALELKLGVQAPQQAVRAPALPPPPPPPMAAPVADRVVPNAPSSTLAMSHLLAVVAVVCFVLAGTFIVKLQAAESFVYDFLTFYHKLLKKDKIYNII